MIKNLALDYNKIYVCPNDRMLFQHDHKNDEFFHTCGASRYIKSHEVYSLLEPFKKQHRLSAKTLRYFPLKTRLKRLFLCLKMADSLSGHEEERSKDRKLRHPTDGPALRDFDRFHPDFTLDYRNVRLALFIDGFNQFRTMSISQRTSPIILMLNNLLLWMCMKSEFSILSLHIPGPPAPGNYTDIYLEPLIDELKL